MNGIRKERYIKSIDLVFFFLSFFRFYYITSHIPVSFIPLQKGAFDSKVVCTVAFIMLALESV